MRRPASLRIARPTAHDRLVIGRTLDVIARSRALLGATSAVSARPSHQPAELVRDHPVALAGGRLQAGPVDDTMQPALLGDYLGHPIDMIEHGGRRIFLPYEASV